MLVFLHWNTAAQNGPVIQICSHCGALLLEDVENCSFCDAPLAESGDGSEPVGVGVPAHEDSAGAYETDDEPSEGNSRGNSVGHSTGVSARTSTSMSAEPEWRREVSRRLEAYRVRRGRNRPDDSQSGLPFSRRSAVLEEDDREIEELELHERSRAVPPQRPVQKKSQNERVEINIQPELDFTSFPDDRAHPQTALVPVASLTVRRHAGALDALFLALTYAGFLGLFHSLGGQVAAGKSGCDRVSGDFLSFLRAVFFSVHHFCGSHTWNATLRAYGGAPGRQPARYTPVAVAQFWLPALRRDSDVGIRVVALG